MIDDWRRRRADCLVSLPPVTRLSMTDSLSPARPSIHPSTFPINNPFPVTHSLAEPWTNSHSGREAPPLLWSQTRRLVDDGQTVPVNVPPEGSTSPARVNSRRLAMGTGQDHQSDGS